MDGKKIKGLRAKYKSAPTGPQNMVQLRCRIATDKGGSKEKTYWAQKLREGVYVEWKNGGDGAHKTNNFIALAPADLVWEKPAVYDLHYDEIRLA